VAGPPLVTGATGFAGSHLLDLLLEDQPSVAAWANPGGRPIPAPADPRRVHWSAVDLLDRDAVAAAIARLQPSVIHHCAGVADVRTGWDAPGYALRVNVFGTHHVLDAVHRAGIECCVLVTGSALVYRPSSAPLTEDSALAPASPYGVSKLAQEMVASRASWCPVMITRSFNHAGPGQSDAYVTSSFARQIAEIEGGQRPPVLQVGNLESRRDITDVRDTVRAYRLIAQRGTPRQPYNVCTGRGYRVGDLLDALVALSRVPVRMEVDPSRLRPSDTPSVIGDPSRLEHDTGWRAEIPIEQTLADLLEYWRHRLVRARPSLQ
jgi:GDP-4-dehydro-6-deoxy-D-mannose reductase